MKSGAYGGAAFKKITKIKSVQVLALLQLGYDVFWTDVDIHYFQDPIPHLLEFSKRFDIVIQSNAPPEEKARNGPERINSGFYLVKSNQRTIAAFQAIVDHAAASDRTEQPSFYAVLCYGHTKGSDRSCVNTNLGVSVFFLPRTTFANGLFYWKGKNSHEILNLKKKPIVAHNNWIEGSDQKIKRMKEASMWLLDENGQCSLSDDQRKSLETDFDESENINS